ncbi:polysaccharide deacetylase family protein [Halarcobacter ebronensis]|nr:polysaccharide deacetylase family protein [Halarcobacter ebronensis]QKF81103.1 polysaccharide deacetylase [Halarcobacter ebronensis]
MKNKIIVVMYHEVLPINTEFLDNSLCTSIDNFIDHLEFYRNTFEIVDVNNIYKKTSKIKLLITFDDGYVGNFKYVFPLLKKYEIPILFFISTDFVSKTNGYWILLLKYVKQKKSSFIFLSKINIFLTPLLIKYNIVNILKLFFKYSYIEKINFYIKNSQIRDMFMDWNQIFEMNSSNLVTFGAHTKTHPILSKLKYEEQHEEIIGSINVLEKKLNTKISNFAYPFGKAIHFNSDSIKICQSRKLNIFTTEKGDNNLFDKYYIKRIGIHNEPVSILQEKLKAYYEM